MACWPRTCRKHSSASFRLRREARFHNGKPVLKHSFDTLVGPHTSPAYKTMLAEVVACEVVNERTVRFVFKAPNRELPPSVACHFSRDWGRASPSTRW